MNERPLNTRPLWFLATLTLLIIWFIFMITSNLLTGLTMWGTLIYTIVQTVRTDRSIQRNRK